MSSNSPDSNPIKDVWSIMQTELDKRRPANNLTQLAKILENIWSGVIELNENFFHVIKLYKVENTYLMLDSA